jgi:hypothetical protein
VSSVVRVLLDARNGDLASSARVSIRVDGKLCDEASGSVVMGGPKVLGAVASQ